MRISGRKMVGEYITDLDMGKYLNYVVSTQPLKGVPAFDSYNVDGAAASGENGEFGNAQGSDVNFTSWSAEKAGTAVSEEVKENVRLLNPMYFIGDGVSSVAPHWYIRHGARDRDTAFLFPSIWLQTAELRQGRKLQAALEPPSQWRLCLERTLCLDGRNRK